MKLTLVHIILFLIPVLSVAQTVPWKSTPTSISHTINISKANVTVDNVPLSTGDAIGVFYDSLGYHACGGVGLWHSFQITAYGNDNMPPNNGFSAAGFGEPFKFKIWKAEEDCIVDSGSIIQFQYQPPVFNDSIYFKVGGKSKLITLAGARKYVYYPKNVYCLGDADPLPVKSTLPDLTFTSQPGLVIHPTTGQINIAASQPGTYTIYFNTRFCLRATSFKIKIKLNADDLNVSVTKPTCTEKGQVQIDESSIHCGTAPFQYRLRNILNGQEFISTNAVLAELPDATYELFITDATSTEIKWKKNIVIAKECEDLVIAPNSSQSNTYYIPYEGIAKIYDRFGLLKKELSIPGNWDATDSNGNLVPMGQYVIICNEDTQIIVSVIK